MDAATLMDWSIRTVSFYKSSVVPLQTQLTTHIYEQLSLMDPSTRLALLGIVILLSLYLLYRTTKSFIRAIFSFFILLFQLAIFAFVLAFLFIHQDSLIQKARDLVKTLDL